MEVSTMSEKKFNCVDFDDDNKRINILIGDKGFVDYKDIAKVSVLNEDAKYRGVSEPFSHQVLTAAFYFFMQEPAFYVGLKIVLKDGSIKAAYVSDNKIHMQTSIYNEEKEGAEKIKKMIDKRITE